MPRFSELGSAALQQRLCQGLTLRTGPFAVRVQSRFRRVAHGLQALYADFEVDDDQGLRDFHISLDPAPWARRWLTPHRPQVRLHLDGHAPFAPLPAAHAFALFEWGMNWCIAAQAHQFWMIHAAVLERGGVGIVLPGQPGAGKSTLSAALMLAGWRLLSDEITLVDLDDGLIHPLARPVGLKNQSIDLIHRFDSRAVIGETSADTHKGDVAHLRPSAASVLGMQQRVQARHLIFPQWQAGAATEFKPRPKAAAFMALAEHSFNYSLLGRRGFDRAGALVNSCECWDFRYSQLDSALRAFEDLA